MDEQAKARLVEAVGTIKNICGNGECNDCPFNCGILCMFEEVPFVWDVESMKARLEHDQTDTPQP